MRRVGLKSAVIAAMLMLAACSERPVGAVVADTPRDVWHAGEEVELRYESCDTLSLYDLSIVVRREANRASEGSVSVRVQCTSPSGVDFESPVVILPEERHRGGSFAENLGEWIRGARFAEEGDYLFTITPTSDLQGVWSVGVKVELFPL